MIDSFVAIDLETTGLSPEKHHMIEVGALRVREGKVVATYSRLINPGYALPQKIVDITNITDEMLEGQAYWEEVCQEVYDFLGEDVLLGHNVGFDYRFLKTFFARSGYSFERQVIDTLQIARELHQDLPSKSLESMCQWYGLQNKSAHRAFEDARVTMQLYFAMLNGRETKEGTTEKAAKMGQPVPYEYKVKKDQPITPRQKNYLLDLLKYHKIDNVQPVDRLTKRQASRVIDQIIFEHGRIQ